MTLIKTDEDLQNYRRVGKIAASVLMDLIPTVRAGVSTLEIAVKCRDLIEKKYDAIASSVGHYNFQFAVNTSLNDVVCHGVPSRDEILQDGDIINLDVTVKKFGFIADTSRM